LNNTRGYPYAVTLKRCADATDADALCVLRTLNATNATKAVDIGISDERVRAVSPTFANDQETLSRVSKVPY